MSRELYIQNSLTGNKEKFEPLNPPFVGMYVCGPTVYNDVHTGNLRTFLSFDMMYRFLLHLGYKVRYVRNITDVGHLENDADAGEDKISKRARLEQLEPMEIVQKYTVGFREVMQVFNALPPSIEPTATGHILEQIEITQKIIDKNLAYVANGSVYFNVNAYQEKFGNYGMLSGRKIEELLAGAGAEKRTLDGQEEKRSPLDFALWKKASPEHIMRWNSPWGEGFPGWHIECSVMSSKYLGEVFDIHGGGMDLKFPHHECEIAQNCAANDQNPVRYWVHGNMLTLNGKKMSKSDGNFVLPGDLLSGNNPLLDKAYSPMAIRFFMMQAHYGSTLDMSIPALGAAEKALQKIFTAMADLATLQPSENNWDVVAFREDCYAAMCNDFNAPVLIATLFEGVKNINLVKEGKLSLDAENLEILKTTFYDFVVEILGLQPELSGSGNQHETLDALMELILSIRKEAREKKDWTTSDKIRDALKNAKVVVKDGEKDSTWHLASN